jgi:hypothetical protein
MDPENPQTALWPTALGAVLFVPVAAGIERLAWYGFRSQMYMLLRESGLDSVDITSIFFFQGFVIALGAVLAVGLSAIIGPQVVAIVGTLGLMAVLGAVDFVPPALLPSVTYVIYGLHGVAAVGHLASVAVVVGRATPMLRNAAFLVLYGMINSGALVSTMGMEVFGSGADLVPSVVFVLPLLLSALFMVGALLLWWKAPPAPRAQTVVSLPLLLGGASAMTVATVLAAGFMQPYPTAFFDLIYSLHAPWPRILPMLNPIIVLGATGVLAVVFLALAVLRYRLPTMPLVAIGLFLLGLLALAGLAISGPLSVAIVLGTAVAEAIALPLLYARAGTDLHWRATALPYALIVAGPTILYALPIPETARVVVGGLLLVGLAVAVGLGGTLLELKTDSGIKLQPISRRPNY